MQCHYKVWLVLILEEKKPILKMYQYFWIDVDVFGNSKIKLINTFKIDST